MARAKTIRFKRLKLEQDISRTCVMLISYVFTNHGEWDTWIEFRDHPEVEEHDYDGTLVYVPAGATVRYGNCQQQVWPAGLRVNQSDNQGGGLAELAMPIEAKFQIVELPNVVPLKAPLKAGLYG